MREIKHFTVLALVIVAICIAGRVDYNDTVIGNMTKETYDVMRQELGNLSRSELVDIYLDNKEYWDSLGNNRY